MREFEACFLEGGGKLAVAVAALAIVLPSNSRAETSAYIDLSVGAIAASNPYLVQGVDTADVGADLTISPAITVQDARSSARLAGSLSLEKFAKQNGIDEAAALALIIKHRLDERTDVSAGADVSSTRAVSRNRLLLSETEIGSLDPGEFPEAPVIDPSLGGLAGRVDRFSSFAAISHILEPNSLISGKGKLGITRIRGGPGRDYRDASIGVNYSKAVSPRTRLLGSAQLGTADYLGQRLGDATIMTALVGAEHQLNDRLRASAQVGFSLVSSVSSKTAVDERAQSVGLSADVDLCNRGRNSTACVSASRIAQPTAVGGVRNVTSFDLAYSRALGRNDTISLSANYAKSGQALNRAALDGAGSSEVVGALASYSHRFTDHLTGFINPSFQLVDNALSRRLTNYQVSVGLSYRFGRSS